MQAAPLQPQPQSQPMPREAPPFPVKSGFLKMKILPEEPAAMADTTPSKPRCRRVAARCRVAGCGGRPWFAPPGSRVPKACKEHREEGEVNVYAPACEAAGCRTRPHYGVEGTRARFCSAHKLDGMVDVLNRRCAAEGCRRQPSWARTKGARAMFCKEHKDDGMVDTKHRTCLHPGCMRLPSKSAAPAASPPPPPPPPPPLELTTSGNSSRSSSSGITALSATADRQAPSADWAESGEALPESALSSSAAATTTTPAAAPRTAVATTARAMGGGGAARYCAAHAPAGAVNVTAGRCRYPGGCSVQPYFGREGAGRQAEFCARHRKRGMTDVRNPRCGAVGCAAQPCCGKEGNPRPSFCLRHAEPDMINFRSEEYRGTSKIRRTTAAKSSSSVR